jgi:hypothetical protein
MRQCPKRCQKGCYFLTECRFIIIKYAERVCVGWRWRTRTSSYSDRDRVQVVSGVWELWAVGELFLADPAYLWSPHKIIMWSHKIISLHPAHIKNLHHQNLHSLAAPHLCSAAGLGHTTCKSGSMDGSMAISMRNVVNARFISLIIYCISDSDAIFVSSSDTLLCNKSRWKFVMCHVLPERPEPWISECPWSSFPSHCSGRWFTFLTFEQRYTTQNLALFFTFCDFNRDKLHSCIAIGGASDVTWFVNFGEIFILRKMLIAESYHHVHMPTEAWPLANGNVNDLLSLAVRVNSLLANNVLGVQASIGLRNECSCRALWTDRRMPIRHLNRKNCLGKAQVPYIYFTHTTAKRC